MSPSDTGSVSNRLQQTLTMAKAQLDPEAVLDMPGQQFSAPAVLGITTSRRQAAKVKSQFAELLDCQPSVAATPVVRMQAGFTNGFKRMHPAFDTARILTKPLGNFITVASRTNQQDRVQAVQVAQLFRPVRGRRKDGSQVAFAWWPQSAHRADSHRLCRSYAAIVSSPVRPLLGSARMLHLQPRSVILCRRIPPVRYLTHWLQWRPS